VEEASQVKWTSQAEEVSQEEEEDHQMKAFQEE
jgi:hypothetical protein